MREIKFRVWCNNKDEWEQNEWLVSRNGEIIDIGYMKPLLESNHILMQYIGRQDINGKEVYEGDVIKFQSDIIGWEHIGVVLFKDCSFMIQMPAMSAYRWTDYTIEKLGHAFVLDGIDTMEDVENNIERIINYYKARK